MSLNITMSKKELKRIDEKLANAQEPEGEYDLTEFVSKTAGISMKKAEDFITIMQLMAQQNMMEEQETANIDSQDIFGL